MKTAGRLVKKKTAVVWLKASKRNKQLFEKLINQHISYAINTEQVGVKTTRRLKLWFHI